MSLINPHLSIWTPCLCTLPDFVALSLVFKLKSVLFGSIQSHSPKWLTSDSKLNNCWFSVCTFRWSRAQQEHWKCWWPCCLWYDHPYPSPNPLRQISFLFFSATKMIAHFVDFSSHYIITPGIIGLQGWKWSLDFGCLSVSVSCRRQQTSLNIPRHREIRAPDLWSVYLSLSTCSNRWTELCWIVLDRLSMCYMSVLRTSYRLMCFVKHVAINGGDLVLICSQQQQQQQLVIAAECWLAVEIAWLHRLSSVVLVRGSDALGCLLLLPLPTRWTTVAAAV